MVNILIKNILGTPLTFPKSMIFVRNKIPTANIMNQTIVLWEKFFLKDVIKLLTIFFSSPFTIFIKIEYKAVIEAPMVTIGIQKNKNKKFNMTISTALDKNLNNGPSK